MCIVNEIIVNVNSGMCTVNEIIVNINSGMCTVNEGNNKITELRTILQRESQNS